MDLTTLADEDLDTLRIDVAVEQARRATLTSAPEKVEALAQQYQQAAGITDGTAYRPPTGAHDAIPPGATRVFEGDLWRNTSGGWLSHSPAEYPAGWTLVSEDTPPVEPDPDNHPAWAEGTTYAVGDTVTFEGTVYRCVQAHTAHVGAGWTPVVYAAGWVKV